MDENELKARIGLYSLLRALYTYPLTENLLITVANLDLPHTSILAPPVALMRRRITEKGGSNGHGIKTRAQLVEHLNVEMTRLMEGPGAPLAPPYASYYLHHGQLMGPEAVAVRRFYVQWEAMPVEGERIPADHIALELGFLAHLAQRAWESEGAGRNALLDAHLRFLKRHLLTWLPAFLRAMRTPARDDFFIALADFTETATKQDVHWLENALASATT